MPAEPARGSRRAVAVLAIALAPLLLAGCEAASARADDALASFGTRPLVRPSERLALEPGETVTELLARGGLSGPDVRRLGDRLRPYTDEAPAGPGATARFHGWPGEPVERIELRLDADRTLDFTLRGAVWDLSVDSVAVRLDTAVVSGLLDGGLYSAKLGGDADRLEVSEKADLAGQLAEVYAWQIDFYRDPRPGDAFRIALERAVRDDGSIRGSRVIAAEYARGGHLVQAYRFQASDEVGVRYYDEWGTALRGAFLAAPLDLVRVTSRFARSRYHPVLRSYRAHAGTDYGAPAGTPVRATGEGIVVRAGWAGDFGLMIELEHATGVRTRYAHLSGVADELARGARVSQGQVIGVVGSTGLSTAPHLHYEFRLNGRPVDPGSVDVPVERPIPPADSDRFERARGDARALLGRVYWPGTVAGVAANPADSPDRSP